MFIFRLPVSKNSKQKGLKLVDLSYQIFEDINKFYTNEDGSLTPRGLKQFYVGRKIRNKGIRKLGFLSLNSMDKYFKKHGDLL